MLNAVLNLLNRYLAVSHLFLKVCRDTEGQQLQNLIIIILLRSLKCLLYRFRYLIQTEFSDLPISFQYCYHLYLTPFLLQP